MRARTLVVGLLGAAWIAANHWVMTRAVPSDWNGVIVVAPMLALFAAWAWQQRRRVVAALAAAAALGLAVQAWRGVGIPPASLYLIQHVTIHLALAGVFGLSLRGGGDSLVTALARRVHGPLAPAMAGYSRRVTIAWTVYFITMAALSLTLFAFAPFEAWAVFANLATPLAMLTMFAGEHVLRYRLHPEFEHATIGQAVRAYSARGSDER